jgi:hypothetical protein
MAGSEKMPRYPKLYSLPMEASFTPVKRKSLIFHNSGNRFGVNEKVLPFLMALFSTGVDT